MENPNLKQNELTPRQTAEYLGEGMTKTDDKQQTTDKRKYYLNIISGCQLPVASCIVGQNWVT